MKILKAKYLENGYFEVKYTGCDPVIQDIIAIKMQVPTDYHIKDFILFIRKIKLEKLTDENFDELKYRNCEVFSIDAMKGIRAYTAAQVVPPLTSNELY